MDEERHHDLEVDPQLVRPVDPGPSSSSASGKWENVCRIKKTPSAPAASRYDQPLVRVEPPQVLDHHERRHHDDLGRQHDRRQDRQKHPALPKELELRQRVAREAP